MIRRVFISVVISIICCSGIATASCWDPSYTYQAAIGISTGSAISSSYSLHINLDLDDLFAQGKVRPDFEDVRIVYFDGVSYIDLDRHIRQASSGYDIWFPIQTAKGANDTSSGEYFVYYGNSSAIDAPKNYNNIYLFYDDFNGSSIGSQWYGNTSYYSVSNGMLVIPAYNGTGNIMYTDSFQKNSVREYAVKVSNLYGRGQLYIHSLGSYSANNDWGNGNRIIHDLDGGSPSTQTVRMDSNMSYYWTHSTTQFQIFQDVIYGNTQTFYAGDSYSDLTLKATAPTTNSNPYGTFKINSVWTKQTWYMDYVLIRENVEIAPTMFYGLEFEATVIPEPLSIACLLISLTGFMLNKKKRKYNVTEQ
ncbi:MAG: PEP-CTERM sorting domain-containing protein [Candidatus Auribacterota bacterium]|jgi:hypothetical protein|nr:PEP-CTERM sorting domain-containing protein [Candidatus Auribacterota bacterium]